MTGMAEVCETSVNVRILCGGLREANIYLHLLEALEDRSGTGAFESFSKRP